MHHHRPVIPYNIYKLHEKPRAITHISFERIRSTEYKYLF